MRRLYGILSILLILSLLCSCADSGTSSSAAPTASTSPEISSPPSPSPPTGGLSAKNEQRKETFRAFLSDNYSALSDAFAGGISGIGFIDLDLDGGMEMLIFDAGASAAMGVQFFDIVDGKVECVSANLDTVKTAFGGIHMSDLAVNANYFDDFRLMKDKSTGKEFFIVQSGNGAADFTYTELVRFGSDDDILTLESLLYKYESTDIDSGETTSAIYKQKGTETSAEEYDTAYKSFFSSADDTGFEAEGAFTWEGNYPSGRDGLLEMADKAFSLYSESYAS